jgi:hypothetical protein
VVLAAGHHFPHKRLKTPARARLLPTAKLRARLAILLGLPDATLLMLLLIRAAR